jgi:hypothetical protein
MRRRSWLVAGSLVLSSLVVVRAQNAPPRPEALLPEQTILYVGTDDLSAMVAHTRASPIGKILAEQEMKDFLEKPAAEVRKLLDQGLAAAKQHPALAQVDVNLDKILAGEYGRAFFAMTHLTLPAPEAFDPANPKIDVGLVIGLEPRAGAVDVLALVRQVIGALAASEGGGPDGAARVKVESLQGDGFAYDRIQAPGGAPPLCFANLGGLSVMTLSETALADLAKRAKSGGPSLLSEASYTRSLAAVGAPSKGDVTVFVQLGRMMQLAHQGISLAMAVEKETEGLAIVDKVFEVTKLESFGPVYASSTWRDGVAVSVAYSEIDPSAGGLCALAALEPIDRTALRFIPKDALSFSLSSFDLAPLWDTAMDALQQAAPEIHGMVTSQIAEFETQVGGADAQGTPNWNIRRDLIGSLRGRFMSVSTPGAATMFGPGGDFVLSLQTPNAEGLDRSLKNLFTLAGKYTGSPITFKEQVHGDAKLQVLDAMSLGTAAMLAGSLQLTYSIHDGKFWFGTTTKALKKALDRSKVTDAQLAALPQKIVQLEAERDALAKAADPAQKPKLDALTKELAEAKSLSENITAKADFAARFVEPPKGAVLTSLSYGDTAKNFENGYTAILGVIPMMMMGMPPGFELPVDLSLLPTGETISQHLFGTVDMSYRVGERGQVTVSRGPFGAETGLVAAAGAAALVGVMATRTDGLRESMGGGGAVVTSESERPKPADPADQARLDLAEINSAITVYMIEYGKTPASLDDLVKPTPEYQDGLLNGAKSVPTDPWGHRYSYKVEGAERYMVWSFGPDGVDNSGAGDDIVQRS